MRIERALLFTSLIVAASSLSVATHALGDEVLLGAERVALVPVRLRRHEILELVDLAFEDAEVRWRVRDLEGTNTAALVSYQWPGNLVEVSTVAVSSASAA